MQEADQKDKGHDPEHINAEAQNDDNRNQYFLMVTSTDSYIDMSCINDADTMMR